MHCILFRKISMFRRNAPINPKRFIQDRDTPISLRVIEVISKSLSIGFFFNSSEYSFPSLLMPSKQKPRRDCLKAKVYSCCQFISTTILFISTLFPRQYFRNAKIIKSSTSRTSRTLPYTYQDYRYRIFLPSFSRHASLPVLPCNEQDCQEHPCHNHSLQNDG